MPISISKSIHTQIKLQSNAVWQFHSCCTEVLRQGVATHMYEIISLLAVHDACPQGMPTCFVQRYHSSHADIASLLTTPGVTISQSVTMADPLLHGSTAQHSTAQHSTAQHSTAQHSTAQHSTAQHSTAQPAAAQVHVTAAAITLQTLCTFTVTDPRCILSGMG